MAATKTAGAARRSLGKRTQRHISIPAGPPAAPALPPDAFAAKGLYGYIWATSGRAQLLLSLLSVFICLFDLMPLELQRRIVNDAISEKAFVLLIWLCGAYALTALAQGLAKFAWNVYRNSVGEAAEGKAS